MAPVRRRGGPGRFHLTTNAAPCDTSPGKPGSGRRRPLRTGVDRRVGDALAGRELAAGQAFAARINSGSPAFPKRPRPTAVRRRARRRRRRPRSHPRARTPRGSPLFEPCPAGSGPPRARRRPTCRHSVLTWTFFTVHWEDWSPGSSAASSMAGRRRRTRATTARRCAPRFSINKAVAASRKSFERTNVFRGHQHHAATNTRRP